MATTTKQLQRLRGWFMVYYISNLIVGTWAFVAVVDAFRFSSLPSVRGLEHVTGSLVIAFWLLVGLTIFGVALALFHQLLRRKD